MEFKVILKENVWNQVHTLMHNIDKINKGLEIGGWLLGDWKLEDDKAQLILDEFIIPKQTVSGAEVDISPESMTDMLREIGAEKGNRIKAHWHIHPFGKGETSWSGTDEEKIKDFCDPAKGREIFVFLLSSENTIKARVEINAKCELKTFNAIYMMKKSFDEIEVLPDFYSDNTKIFDELKARVDLKVEQKSWKYETDDWRSWSRESQQVTLTGEKADKGEYVSKFSDIWNAKFADGKVHLALDDTFYDWMVTSDCLPQELKEYEKMKRKSGIVRLRYKIPKETTQTDFMNALVTEMEGLEELYNETASSNFGYMSNNRIYNMYQ